MKNHPTVFYGCGGGTRTSRPSGYEPDKLPTAPLRDMMHQLSRVVLVTGLEPVRELPRRILSPLRLPIPPHELAPVMCLAIVAFKTNDVKRKFIRSLYASIILEYIFYIHFSMVSQLEISVLVYNLFYGIVFS